MRFFRILCLLVIGFGLAACSSKIRTYNGPNVTALVVHKAERRLFVMHGNEVLKSYEFELGFTPAGHKQFEGDGRTPEGAYRINRRNANSQYHLSLGISYPNEADRAFAREQGKPPGGDIFIHGTPTGIDLRDDWTAGCIAVTNREIEELFAMVPDGTPIFIYP
jgi:murein L,D-transpeptidase YafK